MTEDRVVPLAVTKPAAAAAHRFRLRVYWEDTDAAGIVYYANYLRFIERARSDLVRQAGFDQSALLADEGVGFQVHRCEIDYVLPARLDDELEVETTIERLSGARIDMRQVVYREAERLIDALVRLACVGQGGKPKRIPTALRTKLAANTVTRGDF